MTRQPRAAPFAWLCASALSLAVTATFSGGPAAAAGRALAVAAPAPTATYADLVGLAEAASIVAEVTVQSQALVPPERAPGLAANHARLYVETRTQRVLKGPNALGESVNYLADVPVDAKGRPPKLRKQTFLIFARPVAGQPGMLQLVSPAAQLPLDPAIEERARTVIAQLVAPGAPPRINRVHDVISVAGNLAGESETQMLVDTASGAPASLTVVRRPNMDPTWGVSWSEVASEAAKPPARDTIAWYRLACSLPVGLDPGAFLQTDAAGRQRAEADYQFVLAQLGSCERNLH